MDKNVYHEACLEILSNSSYYEEVPEDPNPKYRKELDKIISEMNTTLEKRKRQDLEKDQEHPVFMAYQKSTRVIAKFHLYDRFVVVLSHAQLDYRNGWTVS